MPEYLHKAFDIRARIVRARRSVICDTSWWHSFVSSKCNSSHKRKHLATVNIVFGYDSRGFYWSAHKMAVHLLFEMFSAFLCVFDWKIRVLVVLRSLENHIVGDGRTALECFDFPLFPLSRCYFKKQFDTKESLRRMFIHGERWEASVVLAMNECSNNVTTFLQLLGEELFADKLVRIVICLNWNLWLEIICWQGKRRKKTRKKLVSLKVLFTLTAEKNFVTANLKGNREKLSELIILINAIEFPWFVWMALNVTATSSGVVSARCRRGNKGNSS